jgi:hypothetical protein
MENSLGIESRIKAFAMNHSMFMEEILQIQEKLNLDFGVKGQENLIENDYYPQFDSELRMQAKQMSKYYELFFCLEKSIRDFVSQTIETIANNTDWWQESYVPDSIKKEVENRIAKELDSGVTQRSDDELDYTTFGELSQIITSNWVIFGSSFTTKKAVEKVMASLNTLRGPIAHCSLLSEDEVSRLKLTMRDWFRLME